MKLYGAEEAFKPFIRPLQWWFRKDRVNPQISYAMSIEGIPNPQGWITGAMASIYSKCDVTGNETSYKRLINLKETDVLYTKAAFDDEEIKAELAERVVKYIDMPREIAFMRKTINTQVLIEGACVWGISLAVLLTIGVKLLLG